MRQARLRLPRRRGTAPETEGGIKSGLWGLADQAMCSASNFITMVLLARALAPSDFGAFVVVYMALQFAGSLQQSLIARPHNVLAASLKGPAFDSYTAYAATAQFVLALAFAAVALFGAGVSYVTEAGLTRLLVALASATFAWQLQEFVRQVRYTRGEAREVFLLDVISYAGQAVVIGLFFAGGMLTGANALYAIGFTSAISAAWGLIRLGLPNRGLSLPIVRRNWQFGKWLVADSLGQWLSTQLYPLLGAAILGLTAAAHFKAVQNICAPVHVVLNAFQSIAVPRAAQAFKTGGKRAMLSFLIPAALLASIPLVAYWLVVGALGKQLLGVLYGDTYQSDATLVWLFNLAYAAQFFVIVTSAGLMAAENTRGIVIGRVVAVVMSLTLGVAMTWQFELYGIVVATALTMLAMGIVLVYQIIEPPAGARRPAERERLLAMLAASRGH